MKRLAITLIPILLSACAPALRDGPPEIKKLAIPQTLVMENHAIQPQENYSLGSNWWQIFNNAQLNELLEAAVKSSPSLAQARSRIDIAQAGIIGAESADYPRIDTANRITRIHQSKDGDHAIYNGKTYTTSELDPLVLTYKLDIFQENEDTISSAKANTEIQRSQYKQSLLVLRAAIIKTYFALGIADRLVQNQNDIINLSKDAAAIKQIAFKAGIETTADPLLEDIHISGAKSKLAELTQKKQALSFALSNLVGYGPDHHVAVTLDEHSFPDRFQIPQSIGLDTISQRPDIQLALWNINYSFHGEKSAQKAFYPNITLRSFWGLNSIGLSNLLKAASQTFAFGPALSLPIFDGGALKGKLEASEAEYDLAIHSYNNTVLTAAQQVATYLAGLDNSKASLEDKSNVYRQTTSLAEISSAEYRAGLSSRLIDVEAKIRVKIAYSGLLEGKLEWLYAITDTATALGGEFQGDAIGTKG